MSKVEPEPEYELAKEFLKSKLGGKSMLFNNGVGMIYVRDGSEKFDCITEAISSIEQCKECLPKNSILKFSGIQLVIETKDQISTDTYERLKNFGFQFQGSIVPFSKDDVWVTTVFLQDPNYWEEDFEEFLKTYNEFRTKKYKDAHSTKRKLLDFVEQVKKDNEGFFTKWSRSDN